jgi:hypothetical protein
MGKRTLSVTPKTVPPALQKRGRKRAANPSPSIVPYEIRLTENREWARMEGGGHFEKDNAVHKTLRDVTKRLDELGIAYAVAGAMALFEHGFRRFTEDVDILISREGLKKAHEHLVGRGYRPKFEGAKNLRDATTGVSVEFILEGHFPGDGRPKPVAFPNPALVAQEFDGIKFLQLPSLVELKLASGMTSPDRAKDLTDVQEIIRILKLANDFGQQLHPFVQPKFTELWETVNGAEKRYITLWRNKWLTSEASSIEEMIQSLRAASDELERMRADGVTLRSDGGTQDDYAFLVTTDPQVAEKYDMHDETEFWGEDLDEDEPDEQEETPATTDRQNEL